MSVSEPSELERVLEWLEGHAAANNAVGATKTGAEYAHVASVVRAMAADFDRLAVHGAHEVLGRENTGCEKDWQRFNGKCDCGLDAARERWRVKP